MLRRARHHRGGAPGRYFGHRRGSSGEEGAFPRVGLYVVLAREASVHVLLDEEVAVGLDGHRAARPRARAHRGKVRRGRHGGHGATKCLARRFVRNFFQRTRFGRADQSTSLTVCDSRKASGCNHPRESRPARQKKIRFADWTMKKSERESILSHAGRTTALPSGGTRRRCIDTPLRRFDVRRGVGGKGLERLASTGEMRTGEGGF